MRFLPIWAVMALVCFAACQNGGFAPGNYKYALVYTENSTSLKAAYINDDTGVLTYTGFSTTMPLNAGTATQLAVDSKNNVYVADGSLTTFYAGHFDNNSNTFSAVADSPYPTSLVGARLPIIHPSEKFLYLYAQADVKISGFSKNSTTGQLTALAGSPFTFTALTGDVNAVINPSGTVMVTPRLGVGIATAVINTTTGALTAGTGSPYALTGATAAIFEPTGRFVYISDYGGNNIYTYSVNSTTAALTFVSVSPTSAIHPITLAVTPNGKFLYALHGTPTGMTAYSINQSTGALTAVGSPVVLTGTVETIVIDPLGRYLYIANFTANYIRGYTINSSSGDLTAITGGTYNLSGSGYGMGFVKLSLIN